MAEYISIERVINKLDEFFSRNDYVSAESHILYWLEEANKEKDNRAKLLLLNELAGLYRKLSKEKNALDTVEKVLELIENMGIEKNIGAATTYINCGTVLKAFSKPEESIPLFKKAEIIYESALDSNDERFGALYNNMALALVDLKRFNEAYVLYEKAISVMKKTDGGLLEVAITYLNIASAKEVELGIENSAAVIDEYLKLAMKILDEHETRDGYYAFVCEKCASVFEYYGYFLYNQELLERVRSIYERSWAFWKIL